MATDGNLLIPIVVHTAKFGYDWSYVPDGLTRDELDACYRLAVERRPEVLEVGTVIDGVLACGRLKFAFSMQLAKDWDANGRNAEYSVFAFLPSFVDLERTDFTEFLARDEFRTPSRQPPKSVPWRFTAPIPSADRTSPSPVPPQSPSDEKPARNWLMTAEPESPSTNWLNVALWLGAAVVVIMALISAFRS